MSRDLCTVYEDQNLAEAERCMIDKGVRRIIVLRRSDDMVRASVVPLERTDLALARRLASSRWTTLR
jgi:predicted transcriptional regulator